MRRALILLLLCATAASAQYVSRRKSTVTYTVAATAGANGSISPSGSVSVASGATQRFTITPNADYFIDTVKVGGVDAGDYGDSAGYSYVNCTKNDSVRVVFKKYEISAGYKNGAFNSLGGGGADVFAWWSEGVSGTTTLSADGTDKHEGAYSCKMVVDASNSGYGVDMSPIATAGTKLKFTIWAKGSAGSPQICITDEGSQNNTITLTTTWTQYSGTYTTGSNIVQIKRWSANSMTVWWDTFTLRVSR